MQTTSVLTVIPSNRRRRRAVEYNTTLIKQYRALTKRRNSRHLMAHEQNSPAFLARCLFHLAQTLFLKHGIADRQHFVDNENVWLQVRSNRKGKPHIHARRIALDGCIKKTFDFGKCHDFVEAPAYVCAGHSKNGTV